MGKNAITKDNWLSTFNLIGAAKINDFTFKRDEQSEKSAWIYNSMNIGIDCGEAHGVVYAELLGGYSEDGENVIYAHGKHDDGTRRQYNGWVLLFDTHFIQGSEIERRLADYHFFSYNANEALFLTEQEKNVLSGLMANVREELKAHGNDDVHDDIIRDYILLILDYCRRFYIRQFKEMTTEGGDILSRFQQVLINYYDTGRQLKDGLPSVRYCASQLCLSAGYFGDIVREALGESPKDYIHGFIVMKAKNLLLSGMQVTQVSEQLGFEYPTHFTRLFKQMTGQTPSQFYAEQRKK